MQISNIHESIIVMKSIDTRFIRNVFEAVQKIRMLNYPAAPRGFNYYKTR